MVKNRLNRETNPLPGEKAGFTPQHDSTGAGDFVDTSPINPLPVKMSDGSKVEITNHKETQNVKDVDVKEELALIKQENIEIKNAQAEIITALGESNASLQATNNTLLSVIKDDRLQSDTQVTGSNVGYSRPGNSTGKHNDTFLRIDEVTGKATIYKYIVDKWVELK